MPGATPAVVRPPAGRHGQSAGGVRQFTGEDLVLQQCANERRPLDSLLQLDTENCLGGFFTHRPRHRQTLAGNRDGKDRRIPGERLAERRVARPIDILDELRLAPPEPLCQDTAVSHGRWFLLCLARKIAERLIFQLVSTTR